MIKRTVSTFLCLPLLSTLTFAAGQGFDLANNCMTPIVMHRVGISSAKVCKFSQKYLDADRRLHRQFIQFLAEHEWKFGDGNLNQETIFIVGLDRDATETNAGTPVSGKDVMVAQKMKDGNYRKLWISAERDGKASWLESILARVDYCDLD